MFKFAAVIGLLAFVLSSWLTGFSLPRFTQGSADYLLMPLLFFICIIIVAQIAAFFFPKS